MIFVVVGTRPEVIKMAPVVAALNRRRIPFRVIATGQHYDWSMMGAFLATFDMKVDHWLQLEIRDLLGSFVEITSGLGTLFTAERPRLVLAVGDTTTVVAAAFAARKTGAAFGHVESGLRAFSRELPEEEHRICADAFADLLFAPTQIAVANLERERVNGRVILTGNTVLDSLQRHAPAPMADRSGVLVTVHRQETVDNPRLLAEVLDAVARLGRDHEVVWPVHPRTRAKVEAAHLAFPATIQVTEPVGHGELLARLARARVAVTDSGGVQEEAAILGTPCVVVRRHTERPETIEAGISLLARIDATAITSAVEMILDDWPRFARPMPELYGDGTAGDKIAQACSDWLAARGSRLADESALPSKRVTLTQREL